MMLNPEVQERVHREVLDRVGANRQLELHHMDMLPYTQVSTLEIAEAQSWALAVFSVTSRRDITLGKAVLFLLTLALLQRDFGNS